MNAPQNCRRHQLKQTATVLLAFIATFIIMHSYPIILSLFHDLGMDTCG